MLKRNKKTKALQTLSMQNRRPEEFNTQKNKFRRAETGPSVLARPNLSLLNRAKEDKRTLSLPQFFSHKESTVGRIYIQLTTLKIIFRFI